MRTATLVQHLLWTRLSLRPWLSLPSRTARIATNKGGQRRFKSKGIRVITKLPAHHLREPIPSPSQSADSSHSLIFSEHDVPPLDFWQGALRLANVPDLTAQRAFEAARSYCSEATNASSRWKAMLQHEHGIDTFTLHYLGTTLIAGSPGPPWRLGLHMLSTASDLGYDASTLSLVRLLTRIAENNKARSQAMFQRANQRFAALIREGRHPDALTLQGIIKASAGDDRQAAQFFSQAIQVAAAEGSNVAKYRPQPMGRAQQEAEAEAEALTQDQVDPEDARETDAPGQTGQVRRPCRWNWEASCYLGLGRCELASGRRAAAEAAFRVLAFELDHPEGYLELGRLQPPGAPERHEYLTKAAVSGENAAAVLLGELYVQEAKEAGLAEEQRKELSLWAAGWFEVAGQDEMARKLRRR